MKPMRYSLVITDTDTSSVAGMVENRYRGEWVKWDDLTAIIEVYELYVEERKRIKKEVIDG